MIAKSLVAVIGLLIAASSAAAQPGYVALPPGVSPAVVYPDSLKQSDAPPIVQGQMTEVIYPSGGEANYEDAPCENCRGGQGAHGGHEHPDTGGNLGILPGCCAGHDNYCQYGDCGFADTWYGGFGHTWWQFPKNCCPPAFVPNEPWLIVTANALVMQRSPSDHASIVNSSIDPNVVLVDAAGMNFEWQAGADLSIASNLIGPFGFEARYFEIDGWQADETLDPASGLRQVPFITPQSLIGLDVFDIRYRSELGSVELNGRWCATPGVVLLFGGRYIELNEELLLRGESFLGTGITNVQSFNDLVGFQMGIESRLATVGPLALDLIGKGGVYGNTAQNRTTYNHSIGVNAESSAERTRTAFVGEVGASVSMQLTKWLAIRGGYQAMWLEGIAVASDQIAVSDPFGAGTATVDVEGSPLYHGAFLGLSGNW